MISKSWQNDIFALNLTIKNIFLISFNLNYLLFKESMIILMVDANIKFL
jgi:hypothetical protein